MLTLGTIVMVSSGAAALYLERPVCLSHPSMVTAVRVRAWTLAGWLERWTVVMIDLIDPARPHVVGHN